VSYKVLKERKNTELVQIYWGKQETKYKNAVSTFKLNLSKTWEQINVPEIKMVLGAEPHNILLVLVLLKLFQRNKNSANIRTEIDYSYSYKDIISIDSFF
jgi:hypothetical protein